MSHGRSKPGAGSLVLRRLIHLPLFSLATKSALAAGLSYAVGSRLPDALGEYAYYAALGALSVMYPAVTDSLREAARAVTAMASGVALAVVLQLLSWTNWLTVALAVGIGTALGGIRWFGGQRTWAATAALFVLTVAGPDPGFFVTGYLIQLPLGAAIGLLVNLLVMPPLPFHDVVESVEQMRRHLVDQLRVIAQLLREPEMPDPDTWEERLRNLGPSRERMRAAARQANRALRGNPRARRNRSAYDALMQRALGIERCSALVDVVGNVMLGDPQSPGWAGNAGLRTRTAEALDRVAVVLEEVIGADGAGLAGLPAAGPVAHQAAEATGPIPERNEQVDAADTAIAELLDEVEDTTFADVESRYAAGSVALAARRCLSTFAPGPQADSAENSGGRDATAA